MVPDGHRTRERIARWGKVSTMTTAFVTGGWADFVKSNVDGTRNVIEACRAAGVRRLVHVSTEAVLIAGEPLINVDETTPRRPDSPAPYPRSKALAEEAVLAASGVERVIVRPRFVWGAGD